MAQCDVSTRRTSMPFLEVAYFQNMEGKGDRSRRVSGVPNFLSYIHGELILATLRTSGGLECLYRDNLLLE
jgi:hypothetical protein